MTLPAEPPDTASGDTTSRDTASGPRLPTLPGRGGPRGYFGELWHPATYRHALYHLLSLPLALLYFTALVTLISAGLGLLVVLIGAGLLLLSLWLVLAFGELERGLGEALLDVPLPRPRRPLRSAGLWDWLGKTLTDAQTYKTALYLGLKLPFSLLVFTLASLLILPGLTLVLATVLPASLFGHLDVLLLDTATSGVWVRLGFLVSGVALSVLGVAVQNLLGRAWAFLSVQLLTDADGSQAARREAVALGQGAQAIHYATDPQDTLRLLLARGLDASAACSAEIRTSDMHLKLGEEQPGERATLYPLNAGETSLGELSVGYGADLPPSSPELAFWAATAAQAATALNTAQLLREASTHGGELERARLARELHDSVAQALYGLSLGTRSARTLLDQGNAAGARQSLDYTVNLADGASAEMKALLFALRPDALEEGGLVSALARLTEMLNLRYGLNATLEALHEPHLPQDTLGALYRIAQEASHNAVKHARGATRVEVALVRSSAPGQPDRWTLSVHDDGRGFDPEAVRGGTLGLRSMRERAAQHALALSIRSAPGEGTTVSVTATEAQAQVQPGLAPPADLTLQKPSLQKAAQDPEALHQNPDLSQTPELQTPELQTPELQTPELQTPELQTPEDRA